MSEFIFDVWVTVISQMKRIVTACISPTIRTTNALGYIDSYFGMRIHLIRFS